MPNSNRVGSHYLSEIRPASAQCRSTCLPCASPSMNWWHKLRRTWNRVPPLPKLGKSLGGGCGGGGGGGGDGGAGLVKLRDEVEMCRYRDTEVMWNMLSIEQREEMV